MTAGAYKYISKQVASSSASIAFSGLSSSYAAYQIIITNMQIATNTANLLMIMNSDSSAVYSYGVYYSVSTGSSNVGGATGATSINLISSISNANTHNAGVINIYNPGSSNKCFIKADLSWYNSAAFYVRSSVGGMYGTAGAVTSITLSASSGNITSGNFYLYGILNS